MTGEQGFAAASVVVSLVALGLSTMLLRRQNQQLEHARNALAILDAIARLTDDAIVSAFSELEGIGERYHDESVRIGFPGSSDDRAMVLVAQYVETVACLARRRVLDPSSWSTRSAS